MPHGVLRLDRDDVTDLTGGYEQTREFSRARSKVEHGRLWRQSRNVDDLRGPPGPAAFVVLWPALSTANGQVPGHRLVRHRPTFADARNVCKQPSVWSCRW